MRTRLEETAGDLLGSAAGFVDTVGRPAADRLLTTADEAIDRMGTNLQAARTRLDAELAQLPGKAMKRLDAVPASTSRRRTVMGFLLGVALGSILVYFFAGDQAEQRREAVRAKIAGERDPAVVGAGNGQVR